MKIHQETIKRFNSLPEFAIFKEHKNEKLEVYYESRADVRGRFSSGAENALGRKRPLDYNIFPFLIFDSFLEKLNNLKESDKDSYDVIHQKDLIKLISPIITLNNWWNAVPTDKFGETKKFTNETSGESYQTAQDLLSIEFNQLIKLYPSILENEIWEIKDFKHFRTHDIYSCQNTCIKIQGFYESGERFPTVNFIIQSNGIMTASEYGEFHTQSNYY